MDQIVMRKSLLLLKKAKNIFGEDSVIDVFVCEDTEDKLNRAVTQLEDWNKDEDGRLIFDFNEIRIVFRNKKVVSFSSSEWSYMCTEDFV
jgi:hypothetical protein